MTERSGGPTAGRRPAHRARWAGRLLLPPALLLSATCRLEDVTIPLGQEVVVVQGVLTLDSSAAAQYIVVERSLTGTAEIPDQDSLRGPPRPPLPISNAVVVVTREDGEAVRYAELPDTAGVYALPRERAEGFLVPGREYRLRVETPDGRVVRGRARMPGRPVVEGMPAEGGSFNRDHDTLHIRWSGGAGTKGVFVQVRPRDLHRRLTFLVFTDSTQFRISGNLPLPFLSDTLPPVVWVAGSRQTLTVAAMDTSFFDALHTGNDPFTGSGFLNRLDGGLGMFGAMAPVNRTVLVRADVDHAFEGRYALRASIGTDSVVGELELYVTRDRLPVLVNALVTGTEGPAASASRAAISDGEAAGRVEYGALHLLLIRPQKRHVLAGVFESGGRTSGTVHDVGGDLRGAFTLTRLP